MTQHIIIIFIIFFLPRLNLHHQKKKSQDRVQNLHKNRIKKNQMMEALLHQNLDHLIHKIVLKKIGKIQRNIVEVILIVKVVGIVVVRGKEIIVGKISVVEAVGEVLEVIAVIVIIVALDDIKNLRDINLNKKRGNLGVEAMIIKKRKNPDRDHQIKSKKRILNSKFFFFFLMNIFSSYFITLI